MNTQERDVLLAVLGYFDPRSEHKMSKRQLHEALLAWLGLPRFVSNPARHFGARDAMRAKLTENPNDQME